MSDPILSWNAIALETLRNSYINRQGEQGGPVLGARALAITHLAMHDAYFGTTDPAHPRYIDNLNVPGLSQPSPPPAPGQATEAVAGAAFTALSMLYPSQTPALTAMLGSLGAPGSESHTYGTSVAEYLLAARAADPGVSSTTYKPQPGHGNHHVDPDNPFQGFYGPDYGANMQLFAATMRFKLAPPPYRQGTSFSPEYLRALRDVKDRGIKPELMALVKQSKRRTPDETLTGLYWAYDGATQLGTPPRLYNRIVRQVAQAQGNTAAQNAQLFALVNTALADAGTLAWEQKYHHNFWRPVVGIREHAASMGPEPEQGENQINPATAKQDCDPHWLPLGAPLTNQLGKNFTPNFPAYPSGHATFGAAALHMVRLFYGHGGTFSDGQGNINDQLNRSDALFKESGKDMSFVSEECNGISHDSNGTVRPKHTRTFPDGLWTMIEENGQSRVYLGVHWIFDAFLVDSDGRPQLDRLSGGLPTGGVPLGLLIAENIYMTARNGSPGVSPLFTAKKEKTGLKPIDTNTHATPDWTQRH